MFIAIHFLMQAVTAIGNEMENLDAVDAGFLINSVFCSRSLGT